MRLGAGSVAIAGEQVNDEQYFSSSTLNPAEHE
jgi:hypothetical protein